MDTRPRRDAGRAVRLSRPLPRLFLVTNDDVIEDSAFVERAASAVVAGGRDCALQLRAHRATGGRLWQLARQLKAAAEGAGATLWLNDRLDVALAVGAHGVQLGMRSLEVTLARRLLGSSGWIGASVHSPAEADEALGRGADVAVLGNVYATPSHPGRPALGLEALRQVALGRPIVAIGGITPERVAEVIEMGAWGVAVLSGVWQVQDTAAAVRRYRQALADALRRTHSD
ncbi:MAG: thiamine phosphate synthase [Gemmatimonadetes bacterium]|nr:thiamine phosphate synthase [Gemmatimonadota bacterium]NIO31585.1 thiamine phosphate synthase [Gemmatimonadota bacterium]